MKPLHIAWKHRARHARADTGHLAGESPITTWRGTAVVVSLSVPGALQIGVIYDADGNVVRTLEAPLPHALRAPHAAVTTWPDEGLAIGVERDIFELVWVDLDGASHASRIARSTPADLRRTSLAATIDGGVLVSTNVRDLDLAALDWPLQRRLDRLHQLQIRAPFDDHEYTTDCLDPTRQRWSAPGRVACVADDVVVLEEGAGVTKQIVGRDPAGAELWRQPAVDRFVVGAPRVPAWSEDRFYVYDRNARRRAAWAREAEIERLHEVNPLHPLPAATAMLARARERERLPIAGLAQIVCASPRTGATHWQVDVDGDVVSCFVHAAWFACLVAAPEGVTLHVWSRDGAELARHALARLRYDLSAWPPNAAEYPCIVHGDDAHLVIAENRTKREGARLYAVRIAAPDAVLWETALPGPCVVAPLMRWLRLFNRVPIAFADDVAYLRWGKQIFGLRA